MGPEESVRVERPPNAIARETSGERVEREDQSEGNGKGGGRQEWIQRRERERKRDCRGTKRERQCSVEGGGTGIWARNACRVINASCYARSLWIWPNQWPIALTPCIPLSPFPLSVPLPPKEQQSEPRLDLWVCPCIRDVGMLLGYKVHSMFDAGGDVRSGAPADRLTFIGLRARAVKADELRIEINSENET